MASSAMATYLARVARQAREEKGRRPYHIAATAPGEPGLDPSTVWRFEQEGTWPRNPDHMIDLYAADLDIEPMEIWRRALELWASEELASPAEAPEETGALVDDIAAQLAAAAEPPRDEATGEQQTRQAGSRRKRA